MAAGCAVLHVPKTVQAFLSANGFGKQLVALSQERDAVGRSRHHGEPLTTATDLGGPEKALVLAAEEVYDAMAYAWSLVLQHAVRMHGAKEFVQEVTRAALQILTDTAALRRDYGVVFDREAHVQVPDASEYSQEPPPKQEGQPVVPSLLVHIRMKHPSDVSCWLCDVLDRRCQHGGGKVWPDAVHGRRTRHVQGPAGRGRRLSALYCVQCTAAAACINEATTGLAS